MRISAGDYKKGDVFLIDPEHILLGQNGRWIDHSEEDILSMVRSYEQDGGQVQPVEVRRVQDNRVMLTLGFRRYKAAVKYNELHPDNPMKLKALVVIHNDEEAFVRNIVENKERKGTSPVDDAFNQKRLREEFGWSDTQIAERYRQAPSYVSRLKKLPSLRKSVLMMVHEKQIGLDAALDMADLSKQDQDDVIATLKEDAEEVKPEPVAAKENAEPAVIVTKPKSVAGKKAKSKKKEAKAKVTKALREKKIAKGHGKARTLAEVREFWESLTGPAESEAMQRLAKSNLVYIGGKVTDGQMEERMKTLLGV